jgi:hypothetical protein
MSTAQSTSRRTSPTRGGSSDPYVHIYIHARAACVEHRGVGNLYVVRDQVLEAFCRILSTEEDAEFREFSSPHMVQMISHSGDDCLL